MKRRRNADQVDGEAAELYGGGGASSSSGTASQLGSAMDELMRHQPTLRVEAINSIIKMSNQLIEIRKNPNYICQKQSSSSSLSSSLCSSSSSKQPTTTTTTNNKRSRTSTTTNHAQGETATE
jgi:E3 ubiquitin-protein ligase HUWE1